MHARDARGCTCAVVYGVPASRTVHALWLVVYLPLELYGWLSHVALTTGVFGEIRLSAVSSRLANAKPLSLSVLVCVDDVRDWMVCGSGFSPGFRTVCQSSALPRTLKVLGAAGVSFPLLGNKQLPRPSWPKVQFSPDSSFPRFRPNFPTLGWFAATAWLRRVQRSPCSAGRHTQLAPTAPVARRPPIALPCRPVVYARARRAIGAYYTIIWSIFGQRDEGVFLRANGPVTGPRQVMRGVPCNVTFVTWVLPRGERDNNQ